MKVTCSVCGTGTAKKVKRPFRTKYNTQNVALPSVEMFHCADCGEDFFTPEQSRSLSVEAKNAVRRMAGLLPPEKIRAIREKLGLTQEELEHLFHQGPKVVTRWESGRVVQNQNADMVLRMLDRDPNTLSLLREIEKEREQAQRKHAREESCELASAGQAS